MGRLDDIREEALRFTLGRMRPSVEEVTKLALELDEQERLQVAEQLVVSVEPSEKWWNAWTAEADRRYQRLASGEDPGLTLEEFWSDDDQT